MGELDKLGEEQAVGLAIVTRACEEPCRQIAANAGQEGSMHCVQRIKEGKGAFWVTTPNRRPSRIWSKPASSIPPRSCVPPAERRLSGWPAHHHAGPDRRSAQGGQARAWWPRRWRDGWHGRHGRHGRHDVVASRDRDIQEAHRFVGHGSAGGGLSITGHRGGCRR